jgi:hypothetical protein
MKKVLLIGMLISLTFCFIAGCYQTGKVAGEAVKGMEEGAKDLQKGYEHGKSSKD